MRKCASLVAILVGCSSSTPSSTAVPPPPEPPTGATQVTPPVTSPVVSTDDAGVEWLTLFDGTSSADFRMSTIRNQPGRDDPGHFAIEDGALVAHPGTDLGLLWYTKPLPADFVLELEWRLSAPDDNSGVFVRFPDLDSKGYDNTAWVAIDFGFEIQINEPGAPDGAPMHTTGAIYAQPSQEFTRVPAKPPGEWNAYSIRVDGQVYTVTLNGAMVTRFTNTLPNRGAPSPAFMGLQTHTGNVAFRNVRVRALR